MLGWPAVTGAVAASMLVKLLVEGAGAAGAALPEAAVATGLVCGIVAAGGGGCWIGVAASDPQPSGSVHATSKTYGLNIFILQCALHRVVTTPRHGNLTTMRWCTTVLDRSLAQSTWSTQCSHSCAAKQKSERCPEVPLIRSKPWRGRPQSEIEISPIDP